MTRIALILTLCAAAFGQTGTGIGTGVKDPDIDWFDSCSDYFRQSSRAVEAISRKGIPAQEIPAVLLIARRSSASPNQVIAARKAGKSFEEIAAQNKVNVPGKDFVEEANVIFLSQYHARKPEEVRAMHAKGASFIAINQEFRRVGGPPKRATEPARAP